MIRFRAALLTVLALVALTPAAPACNIPVFRYALEKWKPDLYQVHVFHKGALSNEDAALVKTLGKHGPGGDVVSNLELNLVDLDRARKEQEQLYAKVGKPALPALAVQAVDL